jgi:HEAT repeat protein
VTDQWAQWRRKVFGDPYLVWHDGPDFRALLRAARRDPAGVAGMLALGIREHDPVAAESVAALASARRLPSGLDEVLRAETATASGTFAVEAARTLHRLTADPAWAAPVLSILAGTEHWSVRLRAAMALVDFPPSPQIVAALAEAVADHDYLVRYHAANTLLRYAGRTSDISADPELFGKLRLDASDLPDGQVHKGWREVADRLVRLT